MSAFEGFLTGFLGRTADVIKERKDKAENYFDQSVERARTIGADNLRQRTDNYQAMLSVANNLVSQAGMPEDLVRMIANEGPQALQEAYETYNIAAEAGTQLDENFWRNAYDFSSEVTQGSNMTLEDFFRQVNGLYGSNLAATTQEGGDPFGAFIASGLGLNAMERAQERLGQYDMGGGFSAADLMAMDARPSTTRPLGETGFGGLDRAFISEQVRVAEEARRGQDPIFDEEGRLRMETRFDEAAEAEADRLFQEELTRISVAGQEADPSLTKEGYLQQARENIALKWLNTLGEDAFRELPFLFPYLPDFEEEEEGGGEITTTTLPPASQLDPDDPIADITIPEPMVEQPEAPTVSEPVVFDGSETDLTLQDGTIARYIGTTPSGKLRYRLPDDSFVEGTKEEIETIIAEGGATRMPSLGLGGMDTSVPLMDE
jgi:hypothetical protein